MTEPIAPRRGRLRGLVRDLALVVGLGGLAAGLVATHRWWQPVLFPAARAPADGPPGDGGREHAAAPVRVALSEAAQKNLKLASAPLRPGTFWKTVTLPGMVIDRPGVTDRAVVAPVTGVVAAVHKAAGDPVRPGEPLFTLKLLSESIHLTQTELFKAARDAELAKAQRKLLAESGVVPQARLVEIDTQLARLAAAARAYRADLANRGLTPEQIDAAATGTFATEMVVAAPARAESPGLEVQEVRAELGRQVQAGEALCLLADHRLLAVEGRAFPDEAKLIDRAAREGWPVEVEFGDDGWPPAGQAFTIAYVANTIDPESRTFRFRFPLDNQARTGSGSGRDEWRFRPGQRVRILVRVERLDDVFVLPAEAVTRDGPEAYVFRRSGDEFERKPVHVVYQDRRHAVVANDGAVPPGVHVALTGAAQLNRMAKAQTNTAPAGFHVHADGSVHSNH